MLKNSCELPEGTVLAVHREKVLVELIDDLKGHTTKSGIIVTGVEHRGAPKRGKVLAVGTECKEDICQGDIVMFNIDRLRGFRMDGLALAAIPWEAIEGIES